MSFRWAVLFYLMLVREIRREAGSRAWRLPRCVDCGIWFLNGDWDPHRHEPRCPFGCRQTRDTKKSAERARIYYQSPEGKQKKKELNGRRHRRKNGSAVEPPKEAPTRDVFPSRRLIDHAILVASLLGVELSKEMVCEVVIAARAFWRQLNLECFRGICETELQGGKHELWPP